MGGAGTKDLTMHSAIMNMCTCRLPKPVVTNWTSLHHPKKFLLCAWRQIYKFCTSGNFYDRHEVRIRLTLKHTHNALNIVISSLTSLHATISYIVLTSPLKLIVQMQRFMNRGYEKHTVAIATISIATSPLHVTATFRAL